MLGALSGWDVTLAPMAKFIFWQCSEEEAKRTEPIIQSTAKKCQKNSSLLGIAQYGHF